MSLSVGGPPLPTRLKALSINGLFCVLFNTLFVSCPRRPVLINISVPNLEAHPFDLSFFVLQFFFIYDKTALSQCLFLLSLRLVMFWPIPTRRHRGFELACLLPTAAPWICIIINMYRAWTLVRIFWNHQPSYSPNTSVH